MGRRPRPNFANAANWDEVANGLDPAVTPPNGADTADFLSGRGTITGPGTAATLGFGGTASWEATSGSNLNAQTGVTVGAGGQGTLLVDGEATITGLGTADEISGGPITTPHPDFAARRWELAGYAPLVLTGDKLVAARRLLRRPARRGLLTL